MHKKKSGQDITPKKKKKKKAATAQNFEKKKKKKGKGLTKPKHCSNSALAHSRFYILRFDLNKTYIQYLRGCFLGFSFKILLCGYLT